MSKWKDIPSIARDVNNGKVSATSLINQALHTIAEKSQYDAVISVVQKRAIERAKFIDSQIAKGKKAGKLAGVPFIAKDNMLAFGAETTAASNILRGFKAPYQATVIERLEA